MTTTPPVNIEAERAALGGMLLESEAAHKVLDMLAEEDFFIEPHRYVFRAIHDLHQQRQAITAITVASYLQAHGQMDTIGGSAVLSSMISESAGTGASLSNARLVRECSIRRQYIRESLAIIERAHDQTITLDDVRNDAETRLYAIGDRGEERVTTRSIGDYAYAAYERLHAATQEDQAPGMLTGWRGINGYLRPFRPGQLIIISGDTGSGKTAWSLNLAEGLAEQGHNGMIYSLEMEGEDLSARAILRHTTYTQDDYDTIQTHEHQDAILTSTYGAVEQLYNLPLWIDEAPGNTIPRIERSIRRHAREHGPLKFVVVDYLQLVPSANEKSRANRYEEVGKISRELKEIAKRYKLTVFALCQLGTKALAEGRCRRPALSHLYESGRIAQDADLVLSLYRPGHYGPEEVKKAGYSQSIEWWRELTEVAVLKSRAGTVAGRHLPVVQFYNGAHYAFRDLSPEEWRQVRSREESE